MRVIINPKAIFFVQASGIVRRMKTEVQLRRILNDQNNRVFVDTALGCLHMRLQDLIRLNRIVLEKSVSSQRVTPAIAGRVDTRWRIGSQRFEDASTSTIQTLVS